jgi:UDP-xylose/UDP-N-acetylglucosamine transporter B4
MDAKTLVPVGMVFGGCMFAIFAMEFVLKGDPNSGNLLTLSAVLMVLFQSIPGRVQSVAGAFRPKPLAAPLKSHMLFALLWVTMSVLANYSFAYKISVPIFTLVRSCNIIATVFLGWLIFGERYSMWQLVCVSAVSVGIFLASAGELMTLTPVQPAACLDCHTPSRIDPRDVDAGSDSSDPNSNEIATWFIGIAMLAFVQLTQGALGHIQAGFYKRYKDLAPKNELCDEYLFTSHVAALLPFLWMREDIIAATRSAFLSEPVPFLPVPVPSRVAWLLINNVSQTICLKGVFRTSASFSALSLTIILSVRKFFSVLVSIVWFSNPWTVFHSIATVLIFGGAFAYSQVPQIGLAPTAKKVD